MHDVGVSARPDRARVFFLLRDFDDVVVKGGNVPLDVLARTVGRYIGGTGA